MLKIGMVANEVSGDLLGGALLQALRNLEPDLQATGVAGSCMMEQGCVSLVDQERLSVMGLVEVLGHLPELLRIRKQLVEHFLRHPPDLFIGIDAPDFNLPLERQLRAAGIPTVHCVSPTVWAWRGGRVHTLRQACDSVLCLFPFEEAFLRQQGVPAHYVGHPLADQIPLEQDKDVMRRALHLPAEGPVLAVLPGSRHGEVQRLLRPFVGAMRLCIDEEPCMRFVIPCVNSGIQERVTAEVAADPRVQSNTLIVAGQSRNAMAASDLVLTASGTATLEALLHHKPMVVGYRVHPLTYALVKGLRLVKVPHVAMANLLASEPWAQEWLQGDCQPQRLARTVLELWRNPKRRAQIEAHYRVLHGQLKQDAAQRAAEQVMALWRQKMSS